MRNQFAEYISGSPDLLEFYTAPPDALLDRAPQARDWDLSLVDAMRAYQDRIGNAATFEGNEAVIITGQQPAMFTGPLYCVYKAATTIRLAQRLEELYNVSVVPVYWIGSEDHDFDEARSAHFLTKSHRSHSFRYAPDGPVDGLPMYRVPLNGSVHEAIDEIAAETAGSEYREEVRAFLHASLDASDSLGDWTARLLARLFRDTPLVFFTPNLPEARALARPIMQTEIDDPLATTALLNETGTKLEALGFPPQVMKNQDECGFFLEVDGRRRKVTYDKGRFTLPDEERMFTREALLAMLQSEPERFSPNVSTRCVVQQCLFPVAAYVAGPGELAYWGQLKPIFARHKQPMPIVYPRARAELTTLKLAKIRRKLGLESTDLSLPEHELAEIVMRSTSTDPAYAICQDRRGKVEAAMADLADGLDAKNKIAGDMARSIAGDIARRLDRLESTILRESESQNGAVRERLSRLLTCLAPDRRPQERYYSIFSFVFEHGWDLVPRIIRELDIESFAMNEVEL